MKRPSPPSSRPYVETAVARGVGPARLLWRHVMRNAANPIITVLGLQFGWLLGGTVLVEVVYSWGGIGSYMYNALQNFDYPVIVAVTLVITVGFVIVNLIVDLLYPVITHGHGAIDGDRGGTLPCRPVSRLQGSGPICGQVVAGPNYPAVASGHHCSPSHCPQNPLTINALNASRHRALSTGSVRTRLVATFSPAAYMELVSPSLSASPSFSVPRRSGLSSAAWPDLGTSSWTVS